MTKLIVTARQPSGNEEKQKINAITTLSGSIAHEIKNYLAAINICAEISESKLSEIRGRVKAANYLLENLQLQIKNIVTGKPTTENFKLCSISKNIQEVLAQYSFKNGERELVNFAAEEVDDFEYTGDPVLTNHVLYNLLKNSLRSLQEAGKGRICITLKCEEKFNKLIFKDTGAGISSTFLPRVFELFASEMTNRGGSGIGLAFCKIIVESYGGKITCESIEGEYTKFILWLPKHYHS